VSRLILVTLLAASNRNTVDLHPAIRWGLPVLLAVPLVYLGWSVARYFGYARAAGVDHFDESYRSGPLVTQGIFRFGGNPMYVCGMTALWVPALLMGSVAALCTALFHHAYVWVHYWCTERPDMRRIYGRL